MKVIEVNHFKKSVKKLRSNEKNFVENAVEAIKKDPSIGKFMKGNFAGDRTYRLKEMPKYRLVYIYDEETNTLILLEFDRRDRVYSKLSRNIYST